MTNSATNWDDILIVIVITAVLSRYWYGQKEG